MAFVSLIISHKLNNQGLFVEKSRDATSCDVSTVKTVIMSVTSDGVRGIAAVGCAGFQAQVF